MTTPTYDSPLHDRLQAAIGSLSLRRVAELTRCPPETVRRYLNGQSPSVEFLTALCDRAGLSPQWLLLGVGPMHTRDVRPAALREANPGELLAAIADTLSRLEDRVARIESYVQTLEVHLRASPPQPLTFQATGTLAAIAHPDPSAAAPTSTGDARDERRPAANLEPKPGVASPAGLIADALPRRRTPER